MKASELRRYGPELKEARRAVDLDAQHLAEYRDRYLHPHPGKKTDQHGPRQKVR